MLPSEELAALSIRPLDPTRPNISLRVVDSGCAAALPLAPPALAIIDRNVRTSAECRELCRRVEAAPGGRVLEVTAGESLKEFKAYRQLVVDLEPCLFRSLLLVGGGTVLNLGLYLAADAGLQNEASPIVVPTNAMSLGDVAIGSLGLLHDGGIKNRRRLICDPALVMICRGVLEAAPLQHRSDGLIELIKHALLQSEDALEVATAAYLHPEEHERELFELACTTAVLKVKVQNAMLSGRPDLKPLLSYGHLHAHAIEAYTSYRVAHSHAVYIGLLVDTALGAPGHTFDHLLRALKGAPLAGTLKRILEGLEGKDLARHYAAKLESTGSEAIEVLYLPRAGSYRTLSHAVEHRRVAFRDVANVLARITRSL